MYNTILLQVRYRKRGKDTRFSDKAPCLNTRNVEKDLLLNQQDFMINEIALRSSETDFQQNQVSSDLLKNLAIIFHKVVFNCQKRQVHSQNEDHRKPPLPFCNI